jgi:hypothetical protein
MADRLSRAHLDEANPVLPGLPRVHCDTATPRRTAVSFAARRAGRGSMFNRFFAALFPLPSLQTIQLMISWRGSLIRSAPDH